MKKYAKDLIAGDIIPPPAHERKWLKNSLTVIETHATISDKRGEWMIVQASFQSPYGPNRSTMKFKIQPTTEVKLLEVK